MKYLKKYETQTEELNKFLEDIIIYHFDNLEVIDMSKYDWEIKKNKMFLYFHFMTIEQDDLITLQDFFNYIKNIDNSATIIFNGEKLPENILQVLVTIKFNENSLKQIQNDIDLKKKQKSFNL